VEKVYYKESVYRLAPTGGEFAEIDQMGVEALGALDACTVGEVVRLAVESLRAVGGAYVLEVSHMVSPRAHGGRRAHPGTKGGFFELIRRKSAHDWPQPRRRRAWDAAYAEKIVALPELSGPFRRCWRARNGWLCVTKCEAR
jgi:ATP phosphoribosyltransferase regulatory subunit HisZ